MTPEEITSFYAWCMSADSRLEPLDPADAVIWAGILEDVPYSEAPQLLKRIYSTHQPYRLQPGTVMDAWVAYRDETQLRVNQVKRIRKKTRMAEFKHIRRELVTAYNRMVQQLPEHVARENNLTPLPVPPPPNEKPAVTNPIGRKRIAALLNQVGRKKPEPAQTIGQTEKNRDAALAALQQRTAQEKN